MAYVFPTTDSACCSDDGDSPESGGRLMDLGRLCEHGSRVD